MKIEKQGAGMMATLSDTERQNLFAALSVVKYPDDLTYGTYIAAVLDAGRAALGDGVTLVAECLSGNAPAPYVRIENLPTDAQLPPTPQPGERFVKATSVSENVLILFGEGAGGSCYGQQTEGSQLVNQVIPDPTHAQRDTGLGYARELKFHIENAALRRLFVGDRSPWLLGLTGVRLTLGKAPATRVADGRLAERSLQADLRQILRQPRYQVRAPYRWDAILPPEHRWTLPMSVIWGEGAAMRICAAFYGDMIRCVDEDAERALAAFEAALERQCERLVVRPGSAVFINNDIAFHSRDPFDPEFSEGRAGRWLQRIFVARDLDVFSDWRTDSDRIFCPR